jgi:hypothetical protein
MFLLAYPNRFWLKDNQEIFPSNSEIELPNSEIKNNCIITVHRVLHIRTVANKFKN